MIAISLSSPVSISTTSASCLGVTKYQYQAEIYNFSGDLLQTYDKGFVNECLDTTHEIPAAVSKEGDIIVKAEVLGNEVGRLQRIFKNNALGVEEFSLASDQQYNSLIEQYFYTYWQASSYQFSSLSVDWSSLSKKDHDESSNLLLQLVTYNETTTSPEEINFSLADISNSLNQEITSELNLTDPVDSSPSFYSYQELVGYNYGDDTLYLLAAYQYSGQGYPSSEIPFVVRVNLTDYSYAFSTLPDLPSEADALIYADPSNLAVSVYINNSRSIYIYSFDQSFVETGLDILVGYNFGGLGYHSFVAATATDTGTVGILDILNGTFWPLSSHILYLGFPSSGNHIIGNDLVLVDHYIQASNGFSLAYTNSFFIIGIMTASLVGRVKVNYSRKNRHK